MAVQVIEYKLKCFKPIWSHVSCAVILLRYCMGWNNTFISPQKCFFHHTDVKIYKIRSLWTLVFTFSPSCKTYSIMRSKFMGILGNGKPEERFHLKIEWHYEELEHCLGLKINVIVLKAAIEGYFFFLNEYLQLYA